jgi:hypothetical protein
MRSRPRNCAYGLLIVAMAIRALMPPGVMPVAAADGTIALAICTGTAVQTLPAPAAIDAHALAGHAPHEHGTAGAEHSHHSGHAQGHLTPCPFAVAASAAPAPALPAVISFVPLLQDAAIFATSLANLPTIVRAQSPRGPPVAS